MTYASEVLADSPAGYWKLDESSFNLADSSGNGLTITSGNGTYTLGSATSPPQGGTSVNYGGGDTGVVMSAPTARPLTLECWFYPTTNDGGAILNRGEDFGSNGWALGIGSGTMDSNGLEVIGLVNTVAWKPSGYTLPALNAWYHLVMTDDGTNIRFYVNGDLKATVASSTPVTPSNEMHIGRQNTSGRAVVGNIAHVAVYSTALSGTRVAAHYNAASGLTVALSPATVTVTPVAPAVSLGTAEVPLSPATITVAPQTLAANAGIVLPLSPATITVTPSAPGLSLSGVDVALTPATVTVTPQALTASIDGANFLALSPATITVTPQSLARTAADTITAGTAENGSTVAGATPASIDPDTGQPPVPAAWTITVHDPDTGALVDTASEALDGSGWEDVWSDLGAGTLRLPADHALTIGRGDVIRCTYRGAAAFQWRATRSVLDRSDDSPGIITWFGPGRLADLTAARIAPSRGFGAQPVEEVRSFGWPAVDYDDASWAADSISLGPQGTPTPYWYGLGDWPDPTTEWMWGPAGTPTWAPTGDVYFRTTFTVDTAGWHTIHLAPDDRGALWLDGQRMLITQSWDNSNNSIVTAKVVLSAGEHTIAVWANNNPGQPGNNPAGVLVALMPEGGGPSILNSGPGWRTLSYPLVPPGVSFGHVIDTLLGEAQDRGLLPELTWDFTGTVDSNGVPWPYIDDVTAKVGSDLWALIDAHVGIDCQAHMPGAAYRLDLYTADGGGPERPYTLDHPTDLDDPDSGVVEARRCTAEGTIATAAHVRYDAGWIYVDTTAPGATPEEITLELRHITSASDADRVARAVLADLGRVREQIELDIDPLPGQLPWHQWTVGDIVTTSDTDGDPTAERVVGIAATIRGDDIDITPTLKDRIAEDIERHERWLKTMSDGAARGNTSATTPPTAPLPSTPPRPVQELTWSLPTWAAFTGGRHEFRSRITGRRWRIDLDEPATGTRTATIRYAGGATIATVTVTAGNTSAAVNAPDVVDNGQAVEVVFTGSEAFGGNVTLEYLLS